MAAVRLVSAASSVLQGDKAAATIMNLHHYWLLPSELMVKLFFQCAPMDLPVTMAIPQTTLSETLQKVNITEFAKLSSPAVNKYID